jgi:anti-anti-sigma factor
MSRNRRPRPQALDRGRRMPAHWLDIHESDSSDGVVRVVLDGELDMATAAAVRTRLCELHLANSSVALDLSGVTFIDCAGLQCLVDALQSPPAAGGMLELTGDLPASVRRLLGLLSAAGLVPPRLAPSA